MQPCSESDAIPNDTPLEPPTRPRPPGVFYHHRLSSHCASKRIGPNFFYYPPPYLQRGKPSHFVQVTNPATMTAAVDQYHSFLTPGIDSALISAGEYPFSNAQPGSDFVDKSWPSMDENNMFGFDGPYTHTDFEQEPRFHMTHLDQSDPPPPSLTPPGAAEFPETYRPAQPQPIDTSYSFEHSRFHHGQATPPDDEVSPNAAFHPAGQGDGVPIKQEITEFLPMEAAIKRKRTSGSHDSQSGPKRRRSRKSVVAPPPNEESLDPVEEEKRNKFLERNRVAASKCRQKKKEWTQNLETQARELQAAKTQMSMLVTSLKDEVMWLKGEMLKHTDCGCHHIREYLSREAENIASGGSGGVRSPLNSPIERRPSSTISSPDEDSAESVASWLGDEQIRFSDPATRVIDDSTAPRLQMDKANKPQTERIEVNQNMSSSGT